MSIEPPIDSSKGDSMKVGTKVRAERARPTTGTWARYAGREGYITGTTRQKLATGAVYVEYGVTFEARFRPEARAEAWFLPDELVAVG